MDEIIRLGNRETHKLSADDPMAALHLNSANLCDDCRNKIEPHKIFAQ